MKFLLTLVLLSLLVLVSGCGIADALNNLTGQFQNTTVKTTDILDQAIGALGKESADWQKILEETRDQLTASAQSTVRREVSDTLERATSTASGEFRCDVDFLRNRVREDLIRIKAGFLGQKVPPLQPALCNVIPLAVDLNLDPSRRNLIEFYGYNFDTTPNLQLLLENDNGSTTDVTPQLAKPTYYHMTVNLGGAGVPLNGSSSKFHLRWQDQELSTISVLQPTTPICQTKTVDPTPASLTIVPQNTHGDTNYGGNGPNVDVQVTADRWFGSTGVGISALVKADFAETGGDGSHASAFELRNIYTPDPGFDVDQLIIGNHQTIWHYTHTDNPGNIDSFDTGGDGPVSHLTFEGLNKGDAASARVTITFNPLRMVLIQHGNCVSPIAANGASSNGQLSPSTNARFNPVLKQLPSDILKRPVQPFSK